jgi:hypothetical protein
VGEVVRDDALVVVVVDAAYYVAGKARGEVACQGVVVDEEPARVLRVEALAREVRQGDEVVWVETCRAENCVELRAQGEVCAGEVGEGDVQGVGGCVGAEVGEEQGRAERVEVCTPLVSILGE